MGKDSEKDGLRVAKTPVKQEAESHFQHNNSYWLRPRKGKEIFSSEAADNEEKDRYKGSKKCSSKKLGSLSVPSKTLQVYHRRRNKCEKVQPFIEGHNKPVQANDSTTNVVSSTVIFSVSNPKYATNYPLQVYNRRFKKNQRYNKCKTVEPSFQEGQNKKRKTSTVSTTEDLKDSPHKKPRLQESSSKSGLIVKHNKNSQINHKKKDAQVPTNETPSDTDKMILRTKVILDEETIREWKFLMEKPEHKGCKSEKCDERWEIERTLFHGRIFYDSFLH
ncbi:hypothetical protein KY290_021698 [Solanum tuberosum]|uniref:Uncharacterized protein n=1 Tax=Solanum tuberosum TaxID=4113 RepID=A0ABQ7V2B1_SOLTU|nr:hypothetical protein KY290_021698 [Solanum tuberosum]